MDSEQDRAACNLRIGQHIRKRREASGLSLRAVAKAIGVTETTLRRWESGRTGIDVASAFGVAKALNTDLVTLLGPTAYAMPIDWPGTWAEFDALFEFATQVQEAAIQFSETASPDLRKAMRKSIEQARQRRAGGGGQTSQEG